MMPIFWATLYMYTFHSNASRRRRWKRLSIIQSRFIRRWYNVCGMYIWWRRLMSLLGLVMRKM